MDPSARGSARPAVRFGIRLHVITPGTCRGAFATLNGST
jgi:hypothetical protein